MTVSSSQPRPSDRWIPWYFVLFFVVLVLTLVPMCYVAVHTGTGVVTDNAYDKGLAYNKAIAAAEKQKALGWSGKISVAPTSAGDSVTVNFTLQDQTGKPLNCTEAKLWLVRPTQAGFDQSVELKAVEPGHYAATVKLPFRGQWDARVAVIADGHDYQMTERVVLP